MATWKRNKLFMAAALLCTVLIAGTAAHAAPDWPSKIKVGLIPTEGGADIIKRFQPLIDHLKKTLQIDVEPFSFYRDLKTPPEGLFKEVSFSGSHGASILAVKNGKVDVAATNNIDMDRMIEKGSVSADDFEMIWRSELIPGAPMCGRKDLPESLKAAFTGALMSFNFDREGIDKIQNGGYAPVSDKTYDVVRYMKRLKAQLQEQKGN